jgi:hypothetical protein
MAGIRALFGVVAMLAPERAGRVLGFPRAQVNAAGAIFAGLFGVRELALAAIVLAAAEDRAMLRRAILINAASDLGDAAIAGRALLRRDGIDRGALMTATPALLGTGIWLALLREAPFSGAPEAG